MYCNINFKTKKELKEAVDSGRQIGVHQPGLGVVPQSKGCEVECSLEGQWYPAPHTWYAVVTLRDGIIVKVR